MTPVSDYKSPFQHVDDELPVQFNPEKGLVASGIYSHRVGMVGLTRLSNSSGGSISALALGPSLQPPLSTKCAHF